MRPLAIAALALPLLAQHGRYLSDSQHPSIGNPQAVAAGSKLFMGSCAGCHGPDGGGGARGPNLVRRSLWHPLSDDAIFNVIRKGVPSAGMPPTQLPDDQTWNLVAFLHALTGPASTNPVPGDAAAGKAIYSGAKAGCANCHAIRGQGGHLGPDLKNGKTLKGVAKNRSNYSLQFVDTAGRLHLIAMNDVRELALSSTTPMPTDYVKRLTRDELRDLLAYLAAQDIRK